MTCSKPKPAATCTTGSPESGPPPCCWFLPGGGPTSPIWLAVSATVSHMAVTTELMRDALERVGVTVVLAAVSQAVVSIQGWDEWWVLPLIALLNAVKVAVASKFGDPNTGGFVNPIGEELDDMAGEYLELDDTGNGVEEDVTQDVTQDPGTDYGD